MHRRLRIVARRLYQFALFSFISLTATHCARIQELGSRFFAKSGTATVKGTVSGLNGTGLIISVNGQLQSVSAGNVSFASSIMNGDAYTLAVAVQPSLPAQVCIFTSPITGVASDGAILFALQCNAPATWAIQGTTTGYAGSGLQVQLNGGEIVTVTGSSFSFSTNISDTQQYNVQVKTQPTGPAQICTAQRNVGVVTGANVTDISINCSTVTFSVGGFVTGLASGSSVTVQVNGAQSTSRAIDGFFTFTNKLADQTAFDVVVQTQPTGQTCSVSRGSGIVEGPGSYAALIQCSSTTHTISGTISGLSGGYTTLVSSAGEYLPVTANGAFSFTRNFAVNSDYVIEVFRNPAAPQQTCTVANGAGTITANVTNVAVSCTTAGYSIGGTSTISGLTSPGLVLRLNGSSDVVVAANSTSFNFNETIASGSSYSVTIASQPTGQKCTLSNASGTAGATVTNVTVNCVNGYTVGGTVTGYTGSNLVLRNTINGTPLDLVISSNTAFTFPDLLVAGDTYSVAVANFPEAPYQNCTITNAAGTIAAANITNVNITCTNVTLAFTAVSSTPSEAAGAHGIALSLVGTTPRAGSVQVTITGGSATDTLDYTLASTTISWAALATPDNVVANIVDDAFNEGNESLQISLSNPVGITLGAQTTHTVTITDNDAASAVGAVIATAEYYDADRNGKIDHVKVTFDKAVKDSSQVGWVNATTNIGVATQWLIAGYSGVQFVPQVCIDRSVPANANCTDGVDITDVVDNSVIWLKFTEGSTYDTGATPDLTGVDVTLKTVATSPNDCYIHTSGATCQTVTAADFGTGTVAEADKAEPIFVAAWSDPIIDAWQLRLQFSEAVDLSAGVGACAGTVTNAAFTYNNVSGSDTSALRTDFADSDGCDSTSGNYYVIPRVNTRFAHGDLRTDTVALASTFYDSLGQSTIATTKTIGYDPNLELYYPMDVAAPVNDTDNTTVHDVTANNRHGTAANGAKRVRDMSEANYHAYYFDGNDDRITPSSVPVLGTGNFTVSSWVKFNDAVRTGRIHQIMYWGTAGANQRAAFQVNDGKLKFELAGGASVTSTKNVVDGWHHFAVAYSGGTAQLYIDGIAENSAAMSPNLTANSPGVGYNPASPTTETALGKLDEVRVYSRALSASEIQKLAVKVPTGILIDLPINSSDTGNDGSGNSYNFTPTGTPAYGADRNNVANGTAVFSGDDRFIGPSVNLGNQFTFSIWAYNTSSSSSQNDSIIATGPSGSPANGIFLIQDTWGTADRKIHLATGNGSSDAWISTSSSFFTTNRWYHIAATLDRTGGIGSIYLDGTLVANGAITTNFPNSNAIHIGRLTNGNGPYVGSLDGFRIYNRILSAEEVKAVATELDRGLVAYYPLDDVAATAKDYSGSGNDLTATNGPTYVSGRDGSANGAYHFTRASSQSLDRSGFSNLPMGGAARTLCAWAKFDTMTANYQSMIGYGNASTGNGSSLDLDTVNNAPEFDSYDNRLGSPIVAAIGVWQHMCATYTGSTPSVYVNGNLEATGTITPINTTGTALRIGRSIGTQYMDGSVDDARIYNRVLSLAEIRELSGFAPGQISGLLVWLDAGRATFSDAGTTLITADGGSVQEWHDLSLNGNKGSTTVIGKRPTFRTNVFNGMPALEYSTAANNDETSLGTFTRNPATSAFTMLSAMKLSAGGILLAQRPGSGAARNFYGRNSTNLAAWFDATPTNANTAFALNTPTIAGLSYNNPNGTFYLNGTTDGSFAKTPTSNNGAWMIGNDDANISATDGHLGEIVIYDQVLTAAELEKVNCYFGKKYAIAVANGCD